jgi:hypothetical protein
LTAALQLTELHVSWIWLLTLIRVGALVLARYKKPM